MTAASDLLTEIVERHLKVTNPHGQTVQLRTNERRLVVAAMDILLHFDLVDMSRINDTGHITPKTDIHPDIDPSKG